MKSVVILLFLALGVSADVFKFNAPLNDESFAPPPPPISVRNPKHDKYWQIWKETHNKNFSPEEDAIR